MGSFFKITEGIVAVSRSLADGRRQIVGIHPPGDCVGYLEINGNYLFQGEALTDVGACAFDRRKFDLFALRNPDVAASVSETLASRLEKAGHQMTVIGQFKAIERVADFLSKIEKLYGARGLPTKPLTLHIRRGEIADHLGLTIETVSRCFSKLKKRNVIALIESDSVVLLDPERLAEIGQVEQ